MSAASLATSVGGVDRDADVGGVQGDGVVDAVAEEGDVDAGAAGDLDDARLLVGADPGEDRRARGWRRPGRRRRARRARRRSGRRSTVESDVAADLGGDDAVVAGDDLDRDAERGELGDRRAGVGLGPVDEGEEPDQVQVVLVGRRRPAELRRRRVPRRRRRGRRRRTAARASRCGLGGHVDAAGEDRLGRALGDQPVDAVGAAAPATDDELALVVERQQAEPLRGPSTAVATAGRVGRRQSATSRALPPTGPSSVMVASLQTRPSSSGSVVGRAGRVERPGRR